MPESNVDLATEWLYISFEKQRDVTEISVSHHVCKMALHVLQSLFSGLSQKGALIIACRVGRGLRHDGRENL